MNCLADPLGIHVHLRCLGISSDALAIKDGFGVFDSVGIGTRIAKDLRRGVCCDLS